MEASGPGKIVQSMGGKLRALRAILDNSAVGIVARDGGLAARGRTFG